MKLLTLLTTGALIALPAHAQPVDLTPQTGTKVESVQTDTKTEIAPNGDKVITTETTRTMEQAGEPVAITPVDDTSTHNDFIAFASEHCRAFIGEGKGNLGFALGKRTAAKFSAGERDAFNRDFSKRVIREYRIDASKPCVLNTVSMKPVERIDHSPKSRRTPADQPAKHEIAVVNGQLASTDAPDVFVSVAYRLERIGVSPWVLTNISLNGQPLVDRYRAEYDRIALNGGTKAVLESF